MREDLRDIERLQHIAEAVNDILEFTEGKTFEEFIQNKMLKHAVYRNFAVIGEAANLLTKEYKEAHPIVEWHRIIGMRHVIVHGYYKADDIVVWQTISEDLPKLHEIIVTLLNFD